MTTFGHHLGSPRPKMGGEQYLFKFANGYGASVIRGPHTYGGDQGLWELAVLDADEGLTYETPITGDVLGHLREVDVAEALDAIELLPMIARTAEPAPLAVPAPDAGNPTPTPQPGVGAAGNRREGALSPAPLSASDATGAERGGSAPVGYTLNPFDPLGRFAYRAGQLQGTLEGLLAVLDGGAGPELQARAIERARAELADETYQ